MAINWNNNLNENSEKNKNNTIDLKNKFIKDFVSDKINNNDIIFMDSIMNNDSISAVVDLDKDMQRFISYNDEFKDIKLDSINIFDLKRWIWKDFIKIKNARNIFLWILSWLYNIDENYKVQVKSKIKLLSIDELYELINSNKKTIDFLNNIIPNLNLRNKKNTFKFLNILSENDIKNRLDEISNKYWKNKKEEIESILYDISTNRIIDTDIRTLFDLDFFNDEEKKELVEVFIPTIDLQKAIDIWLITTEKAKEKKEKILKDSLSGKWLASTLETSIIENTSYSDIILSTKDLISDINSHNLLWTKIWFKNLEDDFKDLLIEGREKLKENWPQSFNELLIVINENNSNNRFKNLNKFKQWNIFNYISKNIDWDIKNIYFRIEFFDDQKKEIWLKLIWEWNKIYSQYYDIKIQNFSYNQFLNTINKNNSVGLDFFTQKEIEEKIYSPNSELGYLDYKKLNINELQQNKDTLSNTYVAWLNSEINDLKNQFETKKDDKELESLIKQKEALLSNYDKNKSDENLLELINFKKFNDMIDEEDSDWKKVWFEKWIFIESLWTIYEVIWIDYKNWNIQLKSWAWIEWANWELTFDIFLDIFKKNKSKRLSVIKDFQSYINLKKLDNEKWWNCEISNWQIKTKIWNDDDSKNSKDIEYLSSSKNDELVKIKKISNNYVTVQFWERKNYSNLDKKTKSKNNIWKDDKWELIYLDKKEITLNLNELDLYIKKYDLYPDWKVWKTIKAEEPKDIQNKFKWSLSSRFFNRFSFNELISWWNMLIEWIKETMKKWNDIHAAKFALSLWKFLPLEIKNDMLIKVERAESEQMDKELDWLWKIDSWDAIKRIKEWLLNKDTPEYKKEAGLMFMASKYWVLYAKWQLWSEKWKFLWYEAFWWRINDELFINVKKESEDNNLPFTEERLMHKLLWKQCWSGWYSGVKRRWRLHKEYEWKIKQWIEDEMAKWLKEASSMRNFNDRKNAAKNEFKWWEFNNGLWKYEWAIKRWGTLVNMSEFPFIVLFSGVWYLLQEEQLNKFKSFVEDWYWWILFTRFLSLTTDMNVFNNMVLEVSKIFENKDPENFKWMYNEAKNIFDNQHNEKISIRDKMENTEEFWWKYWEALTRAMLKLNNQDSKYSKTDKILLTNKDELSEYDNLLNWYVSWAAKFSNEDIMWDQFLEQWTSWLSWKVFEEIWTITNEWTFKSKWVAKSIWYEMIWEIKNSVLYTYDNNEQKNNEIKLSNIERQLSFIFTYIKNRENQRSIIWAIKEWKSDWWELKKLWITSWDIDWLINFSSSEITNMDTVKIKKFLRRISNNIINLKGGYSEENLFNPFNETNDTIWRVKDSVNDTIYDM